MARNGRVVSDADCRVMRLAYFAYRAAYNKLASRCISKRVLRYKLRPKGHQSEHCITLLPHNPRFFQNYLDEDMVRRVKNGVDFDMSLGIVATSLAAIRAASVRALAGVKGANRSTSLLFRTCMLGLK